MHLKTKQNSGKLKRNIKIRGKLYVLFLTFCLLLWQFVRLIAGRMFSLILVRLLKKYKKSFKRIVKYYSYTRIQNIKVLFIKICIDNHRMTEFIHVTTELLWCQLFN